MKKIILLLLPFYTIAQEKKNTTVKDFDVSGSSYPSSLIKINNENYFLTAKELNGNENQLLKLDTSKRRVYPLNIYRYNYFYPKELIQLKDKLVFLSNNKLYSYENDQIRPIENVSSSTFANLTYSKNGFYFREDSNYSKNLYFTNGLNLQQIYLPNENGRKHFIQDVEEDNIYLTLPEEENNMLVKYNPNKGYDTIAFNVLIDSKSKGAALFQDKLLFSKKDNNENNLYYYKQDSISKLTYNTATTNSSIKLNHSFNFLKTDKFLIFEGLDINNQTNLFSIENKFNVKLLKPIIANQQSYFITTKTQKFILDNVIYFTAFNGNNDVILVKSDGTFDGTQVVKNQLPKDFELFYIANNKLFYQIKNNLFSDDLSSNQIKQITSGFSEITYTNLIDDYIYFSAKEEIHGNELYRLNTKTNQYELFVEINKDIDSQVSHFMNGEKYKYFIVQNKLYQYDGATFEQISDQNEKLLEINKYTSEFKDFNVTAEIGDLVIFSNISSEIISVNKKTKEIISLGYSTDNIDLQLRFKKFVTAENKVYFPSNKFGFNIVVSDGTEKGTEAIKANGVEDLNPNYLTVYKNKIYFTGEVLGDTHLYSIDPKTDKLEKLFFLYNYQSNLGSGTFVGVYNDQFIFEFYNKSINAKQLYFIKDQNFSQQLLLTLGNHYVSSSQVVNNQFYFTYNNKLFVTDGTSQNTKQIYASNYERLFNLKSCGESFYFEDEKHQQLFRTTGNSTSIIKKLDEGFKFLDGVCYNNTMYYLNDDYNDLEEHYAKPNYITVSNDQKSNNVEIVHNLFDPINRYGINLKEIAIINNKILFNFYGGTNGQELLIGDINHLSLSTEEIKNPTKKNSQFVIYPNPSTEYFSIDSQLKIESVSIFDSTGKLIRTLINPTKKVDVSFLPRGVYIVKINTKETSETKKIIKY